MRRTQIPSEMFRHLFMLVIVFLTFYPFVYLLSSSLKSNAQIYTQFWAVIPSKVHWSNYATAWAAIAPYMLNTMIVSTLAVVGVVFLASLSAFSFARLSFPGKEVIFYLILMLIMVPQVLTLIPMFILVRDLGLLNTRWALILPYISLGQVFGIFILRSFFASLPEEIFESARIDGASEFVAYRKILLPLSKPILATVAIIEVLSSWNDYVWPLVTISDQKLRTVTVGLAYFRSEFGIALGDLMAGNVLASVPLVILFCVATRYFVEGLSSGALKM